MSQLPTAAPSTVDLQHHKIKNGESGNRDNEAGRFLTQYYFY